MSLPAQNATLFKITQENGEPYHGGSGAWSLPKGKRPGTWRTVVTGRLEPCSNGLHLARKGDLLEWLGPVIWEAEHDGEIIECPDKVVVRKARLLRRVGGWNEQTARLFAADCAERVSKHASDPRCDAAILAARRYAFGLIDDAARAAAARDAAWDAAWDAAKSWQRDRLFQYLTGGIDLEAIKASVAIEGPRS